jgi:hypothetical protein
MTDLWSLRPNWRDPVDVTYAFLTEVISSRAGREQRRAKRQMPRKSLEFGLTVHTHRWRVLMRTMAKNQGALLNMAERTRGARSTVARDRGLNVASRTFTLASVPAWLTVGRTVVLVNGDTTAVRTVEDVTGNTVRFAEGEVANLLANTTMAGAALGSPGTAPTGYTVTGTTNGLTREIVGVGVDALTGFNYVDYRFSGTATVAATLSHYFGALDGGQAAAPGETYIGSAYLALRAGVAPPTTYMSLVARSAVPATVGSFSTATIASALTANLQRFDTAPRLMPAATVSVMVRWGMSLAAGVAYDFTIRVAAPQLETGSVVSPYVAVDPLNPTPPKWPVGTLVCPMLIGRLATDSTMQNLVPGLVEGRVQFDVDPGTEIPETGGVAPLVWNGREVFLPRINWEQAQDLQFVHPTETVDYAQGRIAVFQPIPFGTRIRSADMLRASAAEAEAVLAFFLRCRGQQGEFYMPTDEPDILPQAAILGLGANSIFVNGTSLADAYAGDKVNKALCVKMRDGTRGYCRVSQVRVSGTSTQVILADPLPFRVVVADLSAISWMPVCRLASDSMTISWLTDQVVRMRLVIRTLEDLPAE